MQAGWPVVCLHSCHMFRGAGILLENCSAHRLCKSSKISIDVLCRVARLGVHCALVHMATIVAQATHAYRIIDDHDQV